MSANHLVAALALLEAGYPDYAEAVLADGARDASAAVRAHIQQGATVAAITALRALIQAGAPGAPSRRKGNP